MFFLKKKDISEIINSNKIVEKNLSVRQSESLVKIFKTSDKFDLSDKEIKAVFIFSNFIKCIIHCLL